MTNSSNINLLDKCEFYTNMDVANKEKENKKTLRFDFKIKMFMELVVVEQFCKEIISPAQRG